MIKIIEYENLEEGDLVTWYGVHVLQWEREIRPYGIEPTVAFVQDDDPVIAAAPQLLTALEHIQTWYESNATDDDCPICRYEPPHHHGQCPKELAEQALAAAGGDYDQGDT